jgi:hypothetical protein
MSQKNWTYVRFFYDKCDEAGSLISGQSLKMAAGYAKI